LNILPWHLSKHFKSADLFGLRYCEYNPQRYFCLQDIRTLDNWTDDSYSGYEKYYIIVGERTSDLEGDMAGFRSCRGDLNER
jgi:hypothetical protein